MRGRRTGQSTLYKNHALGAGVAGAVRRLDRFQIPDADRVPACCQERTLRLVRMFEPEET